MEPRRILVENAEFLEEGWLLSGESVVRMRRVLRLQPGDEVEILLVERGRFLVRLEAYTGREQALLRPLRQLPTADPERSIFLAMPLLKHEKIEDVLRQAVELGISGFFPLITDRTVVQVGPERWSRRQKRFERICRESLESSGCARRITIHDPVTFEDFVTGHADEPVMVAPVEPRKNLRVPAIWEWVNRIIQEGVYPDTLYLIVGPEGGWSEKEVTVLKQVSTLVHLGKRTLRSPTAALVALSHLVPLVERSA